MSQDRDEPFRSFATKVRGKAETCTYSTTCSCNAIVDFTDIIISDVLIAGIADLDIRGKILGTDLILNCSVEDVASLVEDKEMARNALPNSVTAISSFKRERGTAGIKHLSPIITKPHLVLTVVLYIKFTPKVPQAGTTGHTVCVLRAIESVGIKPRRQTHMNNALSTEVAAVFAQVSTVSANSEDANNSIQSSQVRLAHHIFSSGGKIGIRPVFLIVQRLT